MFVYNLHSSLGENSLKVESAAAEKSPEKTKPAKSPERKLSTSQGAGGSRKASTYSNCTGKSKLRSVEES